MKHLLRPPSSMDFASTERTLSLFSKSESKDGMTTPLKLRVPNALTTREMLLANRDDREGLEEESESL